MQITKIPLIVGLLIGFSLVVAQAYTTPSQADTALQLSPHQQNVTGVVTNNGKPVENTTITLYQYDGATWSIYGTTFTDANGSYEFTDLPTLTGEQMMRIVWFNLAQDDMQLAFWICNSIGTETTDPTAYNCSFDIANITLRSPLTNVETTLPITFTWDKRTIISDNYQLNLFDLVDGDPSWFTNLAETDQYQLETLPSGFSFAQKYGWRVWVYGTNGSGQSYNHQEIIFAKPNVEPDTFSCMDVTEIPKAECEILVTFYNDTDGPNWLNQGSWLTTNTPCQWQGITCAAGQISELTLTANQLHGDIPAELGQLTHLTILDLSQNQLSGNIPAELGQLTNLTILSLYQNQLSGNIPPELGQLANLTILSLSQNQLNGNIPSELGQLANLTILYLWDNELNGNIPPELGQLTNLRELSFLQNQLSGNIPVELGQLTNLIRVGLSENQLSGNIPPELGQLTNLTILYLWDNELNGNIPPELEQLTNLRELILAQNQLNGNIPPELGQLTNLTIFALSQNQLNGNIPPQLGQLTNLTTLSLWNNQLNGNIPSELGQLTNLTILELSQNQLNSNIPPELGQLTNLQILNLSQNQLNGNVPPQLGQLTNLTTLSLWNNQLSGNIPPELTQLTKLTKFELSQNQLSGNIPSELGQLTNLQILNLSQNQLSSNIPPELGQLTNLTALSLWDNELSGNIPPELAQLTKLTILELSRNQLSGNIPPELAQLTNLTYFNLIQNQLSGNIPPELAQLTNLTFLAFSENQLTGNIPPELAQLTNLATLEFSRNQLSGTIPIGLRNLKNLSLFWAQGNPQLCETDDLLFQVWLTRIDNLQRTGLCNTQRGGNGRFDDPTTLGTAFATDLAVEDLNQSEVVELTDTYLDVFVAEGNNQVDTVWLNEAGTLYDSGQSLGQGDSQAVTLADLDGDGDRDAVVANGQNQPDIIWWNDGEGQFTPGQMLGELSSTSVAVGDVMGDERPEIIVGGLEGHAVWSYINNTYITVTTSLDHVASQALVVTDFDKDNQLDVITLGETEATIWLNEHELATTLDDSTLHFSQTSAFSVTNGQTMVTADMDNDGQLDVVIGHHSANTQQTSSPMANHQAKQTLSAGITLWFGDGTGKVTPGEQTLGETDILAVVLGDLERDGDKDIIMVAEGTDTVWLNDGTGNFKASDQTLDFGDSTAVALADMDNDGDFDILVGGKDNTQDGQIWFNVSETEYQVYLPVLVR